MATLSVQQKGTNWLAIIALFIILAMVGVALYFAYVYLYQTPAVSEEVAKEQIAAKIKIAEIKAASAVDRWKTIRVIGIVGSVLFVLGWILVTWLKQRGEKHGLTIEEVLERGQKMFLKQEAFETLWCNGGSTQRREGSQFRVILAWFSSEPRSLGWEGRSQGMRFLAVLNDDWDHRLPLPNGLTFHQAWDALHEIEESGFSMEKTPEEAAIEKLGQLMRGERVRQEAGNILPGVEV